MNTGYLVSFISLFMLIVGVCLVIAGGVCDGNPKMCSSTDFSNGGMIGGGVSSIASSILMIIVWIISIKNERQEL